MKPMKPLLARAATAVLSAALAAVTAPVASAADCATCMAPPVASSSDWPGGFDTWLPDWPGGSSAVGSGWGQDFPDVVQGDGVRL
ncbi:hypothetical protein ACQKM2_36865 [Streptomyces sp. NPDC004126]|uniref:hypothetical protein n=1 Tax=Streptomyces sp. NPDC004126 TaxID=3390695 RepID=UPI003D0669EA